MYLSLNLLHPLSPLPSSQEGRDALIAQFGSFDARHAVCFLQQDTDRLQNTIEGGFGSLAAFSSSVTDVLESVTNERAIAAEQGV